MSLGSARSLLAPKRRSQLVIRCPGLGFTEPQWLFKSSTIRTGRGRNKRPSDNCSASTAQGSPKLGRGAGFPAFPAPKPGISDLLASNPWVLRNQLVPPLLIYVVPRMEPRDGAARMIGRCPTNRTPSLATLFKPTHPTVLHGQPHLNKKGTSL